MNDAFEAGDDEGSEYYEDEFEREMALTYDDDSAMGRLASGGDGYNRAEEGLGEGSLLSAFVS